MGVIGCLLGFIIVIYLIYNEWSVYIATVVGAAAVMLLNRLPFIDTLLGTYTNGMCVPIKSFFFILLFGNIQAKVYSVTGAAYSIADTIMEKLLKPGASETKRIVVAILLILTIGFILCMGGINASVFIVLMYPIALTIFEYCEIPKRYILGVLGAASYTFTLILPGSPQVTNVAAMTVLGTAADVAPISGILGGLAIVVMSTLLLTISIKKAKANGEYFELHPLDPHYDKDTPKPKFIISVIPLVFLFVLFNIVKININICIIVTLILSIILFWKYFGGKNLREIIKKLREVISTGAAESIHMTLTVSAICGFAAVVTNTAAFTSILDAVTSVNMPPMLICAFVVAVISMLTGGSSTGLLVSLPLIAPKLLELNLSAAVIHRVACHAALTLDSLPYCGAILMLLPLCRMKLKEVYPPLFITTVISTTCALFVVIIWLTLFPGLI